MSPEQIPDSTEARNEFVRRSWGTNAPFWDERMGEGNDFQRLLLNPAVEQLLQPRPRQRILEIACGNGQLARRLADLGAEVVATDFAPRMLEIARGRSSGYEQRISYQLVDATDEAELMALGGPFDAAVCNMALMDMATIEPLARACANLLKPNGPLVFSVLHPCFNSAYTSQVREGHDGPDGRWQVDYLVRVTGYKEPRVSRGEAVLGQPELQLYFHRPLEELFGVFFRAAFVLDGLVEPVLPTDDSRGDPNWSRMRGIPPVLVARMRAFGAFTTA